VATKRVGIPMLEERLGVGVHEASEPPNGVGRAIRAVIVVPARHLTFVLIATHMRGDANDRFVDIAVAEATSPVRGAVLDLVSRLQFKAFVTECWMPDGGLFVRVVERDVVLVRRALSSSDGGHAATVGGGTCGRL